jgi:hypothetical protein
MARAADEKNEIPTAARAILDKATDFELYSLDPAQRLDDKDGGYHGYKVLGKTAIKDADIRKKLVEALAKSAADNDGTVAGCFIPRHGIRAKHDGKTVELVICFQCLQVQVFLDDKKDKGFLITSTPQPVFDKVLTDAKVPLPKKE